MPLFEITVPMLRRTTLHLSGFASIDFAVLKLYSARAADGSVTVTPLQAGSPQYGSEGGPVTLPVFKTGDWRLRRQWCVRLAHASAKTAIDFWVDRNSRLTVPCLIGHGFGGEPSIHIARKQVASAKDAWLTIQAPLGAIGVLYNFIMDPASSVRLPAEQNAFPLFLSFRASEC